MFLIEACVPGADMITHWPYSLHFAYDRAAYVIAQSGRIIDDKDD